MKNLVVVAFLIAMPTWAQTALRLGGFHAYLFNSKTGKLSADMLAKGAPELGNVPASEFASVSTLVVVRVEFGAQTAIPEKVQIRLIATDSGSLPFGEKGGKARDVVILDKVSKLGPVNEKGHSFVGFWLEGTGCHNIRLKATVVGVKDAVPLMGTLPFTCFE